MKIKNMDLLIAIKNYTKHLYDSDFKLNISTLYKIRKNMDAVEKAYSPCGKAVDDVIKMRGDKTDEEVQSEIDILMSEECEVEIEKIPISAFDGVSATPAFVNTIFFMLG